MYKVSFTGYRPEKLPFFGEDDPMCADLKERLFKKIKELADDGATEFYSGMALGVDTWSAEAVLRLKEERPEIRLIAVIPCPEQDIRWSLKDKKRYHDILERCDKRMTISPKYTKDCMHKRNRVLVELCDILVAVFDGKEGGTKYTVEYAQKKARNIILIPIA